jgi:hypothetical protein
MKSILALIFSFLYMQAVVAAPLALPVQDVGPVGPAVGEVLGTVRDVCQTLTPLSCLV